MNKSSTRADSDTPVTRGRSGPVLYELVDKEGAVRPEKHMTVQSAATLAAILWPDQEHDEDRTGKGWDVQVVGS